jgi:hypothetical protein
MSWTVEHERDHLGDLLGGDLGLAVELLDKSVGPCGRVGAAAAVPQTDRP